MNLREYEIMYHVEDRHWWYIALRGVIEHYWRKRMSVSAPKVLDIGCGTGASLEWLPRGPRAGDCVGVDFSKEAVRFCRTRGLDRTACASALSLPFPPSTFDAALFCDVLCHRSIPDPVEALREIHAVLKPGGLLFMNLPAYQWLYSSHDVAVHTARRFTRGQTIALLRAAGFELLDTTYWNTVLFPPILLTRMWRKYFPPPESDLAGFHDGAANRLLSRFLGIERALLRLAPMPFGLSVFAVGRKA